MTKYEIKYCPICQEGFECKPGNITQCECFEIHLSAEAAQHIREKYENCLCRNCLKQLEKDFKNDSRSSFM